MLKVSSTESTLESVASALSLNVYPNPSAASEDFAVVLDGIQISNEKVSLIIYNMIGAKAYQAEIVTKEEQRMVIKPETKLAPGVYMVEVQLEGKAIREKFIVK